MSEKRQNEVPLLEVDHLAVTFYTPRGAFRVVRKRPRDETRKIALDLLTKVGIPEKALAYPIQLSSISLGNKHSFYYLIAQSREK